MTQPDPRAPKTGLAGLVSDQTRARIRGLADRPARLLLALGCSPNGVTIAGFLVCTLAGLAAALGASLPAAGLFLVGSLADGLDGAMARRAGRASAFGAYLDSLLDRAGEAVILAGIAAGAASGALVPAAPALTALAATLALGAGYLVSYARARAEGLGIAIGEQGLMQRGERALLLTVSLVLSALITPLALTAGLGLLAALSAITVVQRIGAVRRALQIPEIPGAERR